MLAALLPEEKKEEPVKEKKETKKPASEKKASTKQAEKVEVVEAEDVLEEDTQILVLRDNAKAELAQIQTIAEGIEYLHKVESIATWIKAEKKDAELQNMVAEQKIRTQRILGELIKEGQESGELATQQKHGKGIQSSVQPDDTRKTLSDIGISRNQSSIYKQIAGIPEKEFEQFITEKKEAVTDAVSELTTKGAVAFAKRGKPAAPKKATSNSPKLDNEKELLLIVDDLNSNYTKVERKFIVDKIKL
jgi:hypothetical protein